jgi:hypothetical protein
MINEGPGEHDRHLMDDAEETVACAHCGRQIWAYAPRCPHCGVHFSGEAWEFHPAGAGRSGRIRAWVVITAVLLVAVIILMGVLRIW